MTSLVILGILGIAGLFWLSTPAGCAYALTADWLIQIGFVCPLG